MNAANERRNLPSASSIHRYDLCPGSFLLEQQFGHDEGSQDAAIGNRIHAVLAGEKLELTDDEEQTAERCREIERQLMASVFDGMDNIAVIREERLWAYDEDLNRSWSGKPDVVYHSASRALVIDYKTGRGEVEHAGGNLQLRALAVLAHEHHGVTDITVAIIQPLASPSFSTCRYQPDDLRQAAQEVHELMNLVMVPDQPRVPSTTPCRYCKAKAYCPEARAVVHGLPSKVPRDGNEIALSPEQIAVFLDCAPTAEAVIEAVRAKARRLLEADPGAIPGWSLKAGATRESITQPETVFGRFLEAGGKPEQFMPCVTLAKTKFKDAVRAATGEKGRALDQRIEGLLDGCTETKASAPSLVKIKEDLR